MMTTHGIHFFFIYYIGVGAERRPLTPHIQKVKIIKNRQSKGTQQKSIVKLWPNLGCHDCSVQNQGLLCLHLWKGYFLISSKIAISP